MSEIKVNKVSPATGTAITLGDSGDTFTVPSGATIVNSGTASGFGGGKVLQVVSTTKTDAFTSTSGTFVDVTGLTASITPSATSSKVLVLVSISGGCTSERLKIGLIENSTLISAGVASGSRPGVTGDIRGAASTQHSWSINHLAEPATTSSIGEFSS